MTTDNGNAITLSIRELVASLGIEAPTALDLLRILPPGEAARVVGLKDQSMRRLRMVGGGPPFVRLTPSSRGRVGYRMLDLLRWLAARTHGSTSGESWPAPAVGAAVGGAR